MPFVNRFNAASPPNHLACIGRNDCSLTAVRTSIIKHLSVRNVSHQFKNHSTKNGEGYTGGSFCKYVHENGVGRCFGDWALR